MSGASTVRYVVEHQTLQPYTWEWTLQIQTGFTGLLETQSRWSGWKGGSQTHLLIQFGHSHKLWVSARDHSGGKRQSKKLPTWGASGPPDKLFGQNVSLIGVSPVLVIPCYSISLMRCSIQFGMRRLQILLLLTKTPQRYLFSFPEQHQQQ